MERITINNPDELKAFIEAQKVARQHACAVFIASRAALRISPYAIKYFEFNGDEFKRFDISIIMRASSYRKHYVSSKILFNIMFSIKRCSIHAAIERRFFRSSADS